MMMMIPRILCGWMRRLRLHRILGFLVVVVMVMLVLFIRVHDLPAFSTGHIVHRFPFAASRRDLTESRMAPHGFRPPSGGDPVNFLDQECEMCDNNAPVVFDKEAQAMEPYVRELGQEKIQLYRHFHGAEPWPQLEVDDSVPGQVPPTVHYLWCKPGTSLGFHHYLGLLSAIRLFKPVKFIFHYSLLPRLDHDMYYSWFLELKQSLPSLVLSPLPKDHPPCGSSKLLDTMLTRLQDAGGIFLGSNVIITRVPRDVSHRPFWFAFSPSEDSQTDRSSRVEVTQGVIIANKGFGDQAKQQYLEQILGSHAECVKPEVFNKHPPDVEGNARCVVVQDTPDIYPVAIMYSNSSFSQLARWMYYGTRASMHPNTKEGPPIPRISHLIWFSRHPHKMEFYQFLTVLSALYVGGFHHVYIHGNAGFSGRWWDALRGENVTFVHMEVPEMIFQQEVQNPSHQSDVTRYTILNKYGGAYHDFEAMWTMRVPDWLLDYPCVATSDWAAYGEFPDGINPGVLLCKRHAPWLRYNLAAHRYYIEKNFVWNAVLMSYRVFERHPDQLLYYRHLQVMCDLGICHPSWEPGFRRDIEDRRSTVPFDWRKDTLVVHVTRPDPEVSFISPHTLREGTDMFAEIGRNILEKSGRMDLLK